MILQEIATQIGTYIVNHPVASISYAITGATVTLQALTYVLPNTKWDNKALRFVKELTAHIALDSNAKLLKIDFDDEINKKE